MNDVEQTKYLGSKSSGGIRSGSGRRSAPSLLSDASGDNRPTPDAMRSARRRWATGVAILTTSGGAATPYYRGITVNAFSVVSLDPPIILVCIQRASEMAAHLSATKHFALTILDRDHESLADRFAGLGPPPDGQFTGIRYQLAPSGCPVMADPAAWFDCNERQSIEEGDHIVILSDVAALGLGTTTGDPLLSFDGRYVRLDQA